MTNVTTTQQFKDWIQITFALPLSDSEMDDLLKLYPSDIVQGSPYETGILNALTPQASSLENQPFRVYSS